MSDTEQNARIEKFAQGHLDRVHTVAGGATKAALAWLVALVIVWLQLIEPKLHQVRAAQASLHDVAATLYLGPEGRGQEQRFSGIEAIAQAQQIELPFSIKMTLAPEWVPTLWLAMAFALAWYLLDTRRRVLTLAARGARLLSGLDTQPLYTRSVTGSAMWWLAPLPQLKGIAVNSEALRRALGWGSRNQAGTAVLIAGAVLLILAETRVFYLGFCISSYLRGIDRSGGLASAYQPTAWFFAVALNFAFLAASVLCVREWFAPGEVPDPMPGEKTGELPPNVRRRHLLRQVSTAAAVVGATAIWESASVFAQALSPKVHSGADPRNSARTSHDRGVRHRKKKHFPIPHMNDGLYVNQRNGTVHAATRMCKKCLIATHPRTLAPIKPEEVHWNGRRTSLAVATAPLLRFAPAKTAAFRPKDAGKGTATPPAARPEPHPHAEHRVFMIEQRALDLLAAGDPSAAASLLLDAAQATPTFGQKSNMRLYDLLAGLSVRYGLDGVRTALLHIVEAELKTVSGIAAVVQPDRRSKIIAYLYELAGNGGGRLQARASYAQAKRHHKPHHHTPKLSVPSNATLRAKDSKPANLPHNEYMQRTAADRMDKWRLPSDQIARTRWGQFWVQPGPITWAKVKLPARSAQQG